MGNNGSSFEEDTHRSLTQYERQQLLQACKDGDASLTSRIIMRTNQEADINFGPESEGGDTPLIWAVRNNHVSCVEKLIAHPFIHCLKSNLKGESALWIAATNGNLDIFQKLIDQKSANMYAQDASANTLLHILPLNLQADKTMGPKYLDIARVLISKADRFLAGQKNQQGRTPLMICAEYSHHDGDGGDSNFYLDYAKLLVQIPQINMNATSNRRHFTALHTAVKNSDLRFIKFLVENGACVNVTDATGLTPLHIAAEQGSEECCEYLLRDGASVTFCRDVMGNTPLHLAAQNGHFRCVEAIASSNPCAGFCLAKNKQQYTALDFARSNCHDDVVELLTNIAAANQGVSAGSSRAPFRIQLCSDLHIEAIPESNWDQIIETIIPSAPYLGLLGDIGTTLGKNLAKYTRFLQHLSDKFERIFVLAGNHEFYAHSDIGTHQALQEMCDKFNNVIFMHKGTALDKRRILSRDGRTFRIIGATLWSHVKEQSVKSVEFGLNDYRKIVIRKERATSSDNDNDNDNEVDTDVNCHSNNTDSDQGQYKFRPLTVQDTNRWHEEDVVFIQQEVEEAERSGEIPIVFSHHSPVVGCGSSDPEHFGSDINEAFATDLTRLMKPSIPLWAYGHTHWVNDLVVGQTRIVSNPRGYPREAARSYDPSFIVEI